MKKSLIIVLVVTLLMFSGCTAININIPSAESPQALTASDDKDEKLIGKLKGQDIERISLKNLEGSESLVTEESDSEYIIALLSTTCEACKDTVTDLLSISEVPIKYVFRLDTFEEIEDTFTFPPKERKNVFSGVESENNIIQDLFPFESLPVLIKISDGEIKDILVGYSDTEYLKEYIEASNVGEPLQ